MPKIRSDKLQVRDVIKCAYFQNAYWPSKSSNVAMVGDPSKGIAAGNPERAKQWFIVDNIEQNGDGFDIMVQALAPSGARDPKGERLLLHVLGGTVWTFKYWGRMSNDGRTITYEIR
ncbi:MAG: hypothetical protein QY323_03930 [Patescibacteria group bacterium]|nr:MAG: hypothetical protein QY323_03930 [Patescibacteria group bacterium]